MRPHIKRINTQRFEISHAFARCVLLLPTSYVRIDCLYVSRYIQYSITIGLFEGISLEGILLLFEFEIHGLVFPAGTAEGRGKGLQAHVGNIRYHNLIENVTQRYDVGSVAEKKEITAGIVNAIKIASGRFLKDNGAGWVEVDDEVARFKVCLFLSLKGTKSSHQTPLLPPVMLMIATMLQLHPSK